MKKLFNAAYWIGISMIVIPLIWNIVEYLVDSKDSTGSIIAIVVELVSISIGIVIASIGMVGGTLTHIIEIEDGIGQSDADEFIKKPH